MTATPSTRPGHLRVGLIALVAVGGAIGTGLRAWLAEVAPPVGGVSWTILGINLAGAFLLGVLLDVLAHRGPDEGRRRTIRLFVGTGVLGGFTTYSTLATDTARLIEDGHATAGTGYAVVTVVGGLASVVLGFLVAAVLAPSPATAEPATTGTGPTEPDA